MADTVRLRIDLAKLAANLSEAEGSALQLDDARAFLIRNSFIPLGRDVWGCEEISLRLLDRSEILEIEQRS